MVASRPKIITSDVSLREVCKRLPRTSNLYSHSSEHLRTLPFRYSHLTRSIMHTDPKQSSQFSGHNYEKKKAAASNDEEEDPVDTLLKKTGCYQQNLAIQECMFEHRDWRKCQMFVQEMKECMTAHELRKNLERQRANSS